MALTPDTKCNKCGHVFPFAQSMHQCPYCDSNYSRTNYISPPDSMVCFPPPIPNIEIIQWWEQKKGRETPQSEHDLLIPSRQTATKQQTTF